MYQGDDLRGCSDEWLEGWGLQSCIMRTTCCGMSGARGDDCVDVLLMFGYSALEQGSAHLKINVSNDAVNADFIFWRL